MTAEFDKNTDRELETLLETLRAETAEEASPDLLARILDDAYDTQDSLVTASTAEPVKPAPATRSRGLLTSLLEAIGGWPAVAGLATATVAGVWIGYNPPAAFDELTLTVLDSNYGYEMNIDDTLAGFDDLLADG
ncbi:dihydroorotate dehydrogenase [Tropicimonas sp. TH_r6]|uniref:dihydroorotate dehydrogenase n=1 Tax=Tropicimonas sp. TH_r6 TaxID=3082085 RepID=UPI00295330B5|nr:dihydroorotate dehydrogenase [Tropicimonas sp. TH_r6]MDV7144231.1 dihydroorotate dehydrogenase [Tropicimonas sp. TH_r6]